ncbi:MAG: hypothetical protein JWP76_1113 [Dactylosporangium sp.]|nr:hypothetical protein [Dactylosporangium sp.]
MMLGESVPSGALDNGAFVSQPVPAWLLDPEGGGPHGLLIMSIKEARAALSHSVLIAAQVVSASRPLRSGSVLVVGHQDHPAALGQQVDDRAQDEGDQPGARDQAGVGTGDG